MTRLLKPPVPSLGLYRIHPTSNSFESCSTFASIPHARTHVVHGPSVFPLTRYSQTTHPPPSISSVDGFQSPPTIRLRTPRGVRMRHPELRDLILISFTLHCCAYSVPSVSCPSPHPFHLPSAFTPTGCSAIRLLRLVPGRYSALLTGVQSQIK